MNLLYPFQKLKEMWLNKAFWATLLVPLSQLIGDLNNSLLHTLIILIICDWITGLMKAIMCKKISSQAMATGAVKIAVYFFLMIVSYRISTMNIAFDFVDTLVFSYLSITEGISVLENLFNICLMKQIDLPILGQLVGYFLRLREGQIKQSPLKKIKIDTDKIKIN